MIETDVLDSGVVKCFNDSHLLLILGPNFEVRTKDNFGIASILFVQSVTTQVYNSRTFLY